MDDEREYVTIEVAKILHRTDKAVLAEIDGDKVWIPLSQIEDDEDCVPEYVNVELSITAWIADKLGLK
jgi:hypothetical protein